MEKSGLYKLHAVLEATLFVAIIAAVFIGTLLGGGFQPTDRYHLRDWRKSDSYLKEVLEKREVTLITRNTPQTYYLYRDEAMGFEYDLAKAFADFIGVRLTVVLVEDWPAMLSKLEETPTGFIAATLPILSSRSDMAVFSDSYMTSQPHIIVHRNNRQVRGVEDLSGQVVHVRKGSVYEEMLEAVQNQGIQVEIAADPDVGTEDLIQGINEGAVDITIAYNHIALSSRRYYPQVEIREAITTTPIPIGWAVSPKAEGLLGEINLFFRTIREDGRFKEIFDRYYADIQPFDFVDLRTYHRRLKSRLPRYQSIIQNAAERYGFDWRFIAAQIYQESHFDPMAKSHAGAYGLMQLTLNTAAHFGVEDIHDPEENIWAGVRHLRYLYDYFNEAEGEDRLYLALAAYNIGQGHLMDARRLARQQQLDPNKWSSVSETLPLLRQSKYYRQSRYGFCRGDEPVKYVKQTMLYYDILKYLNILQATT